MNEDKIKRAAARLEANLPLCSNQQNLPRELRSLHQAILEYYLHHGRAPRRGDLETELDWDDAVTRLRAKAIIVADDSGAIVGAYPFIDEEREFRVISQHGEANAMCAFDALAVSSMFSTAIRIQSRCRLSGREIVIEQRGADISQVEPGYRVFAAIDWNARDAAVSCAASLCTEMMFIAGDRAAQGWVATDSEQRELFSLDEAHAMICRVFLPLMQ